MLHPGAWLGWFLAAVAVVLVLDDPITSALAIAVTVVVASRLAMRGPDGRAWSLMLRLGLAFLALRVVLFGLTGHTGPTELATLPRAQLPAWLGGFGIGGRITGEVVAQAASEGLKIAALLVACGVVLSVVAVHRIVRALPRFAFEAGLVVGIALAFVPTVVRAASDVRDAQRLRGHRFRGLRSWRPLIVPVLDAALARSLTLAASMETRGFGRTDADPRAHAVLVAGAIALSGGGALAIFGRPWGVVVAGAGVVALVLGARSMGASQRRTRYRPERIEAWDRVLLFCAAGAVAMAALARATGADAWYAYPVVSWPRAHVLGVCAPLMLLAPVVITQVQRARLMRASEHQPPEPETQPASPPAIESETQPEMAT